MHSTLSVFRIKPGQAQFSPRKQLMLCHYIDMFVCYRARNHAQSTPEGAGVIGQARVLSCSLKGRNVVGVTTSLIEYF